MNNTINKRIELFREKFKCSEFKDALCENKGTYTEAEQFLKESMEQVRKETLEEAQRIVIENDVTFSKTHKQLEELKPNE